MCGSEPVGWLSISSGGVLGGRRVRDTPTIGALSELRWLDLRTGHAYIASGELTMVARAENDWLNDPMSPARSSSAPALTFDANGLAIGRSDARLRVSCIGTTYAFRHSLDGVTLQLTRRFALRPDAVSTPAPGHGRSPLSNRRSPRPLRRTAGHCRPTRRRQS